VDSLSGEWAEGDQRQLRALVEAAIKVEEVSIRGLHALEFDLRDERVVDASERLIAVWTGMRRGGTFYTMCAAWARGVAVQEVLLPGASSPRIEGRGI
jgi:hypothetical protein